MNVTLRYETGNEFGTGKGSPSYVASITTKGADVRIDFKFPKPQQGKSDPKVSSAKVKSLTLSLTSHEALQIASSIIAQAHHPSIHDKIARWMPPHGMPVLEESIWKGKLTAAKFNRWNKSVVLTNGTDHHIGTVSLEIRYAVQGSNTERVEKSVTIRKLVDLLRSASCTVNIDKTDLPSSPFFRKKVMEIMAVEITEATGVSQAELRDL